MYCTVTKIFFSFLAYTINIFLAYVRSHSYFLSALSLSMAVFLRPIFQGKKKNGYIKHICAYASLRGKQNIIMILRHSKYFVWTCSSGDTLPSTLVEMVFRQGLYWAIRTPTTSFPKGSE